MNYKEANEILEKNNQHHLLKYYEELSDEKKENLLLQIGSIDFKVLDLIKNKSELATKGEIEPLAVMQLEEIEKKEAHFRKTGISAIQQKKIAAVLLAGGMGTRLGSKEPKGMYNIGITKEVFIFERLIQNLLNVVNQAGTWIHLFIMTSDKNHEITVNFFKKMNYFGYNIEYITFFMQEMSVACDYNGKIYLEDKGQISMSPNGNGGWFSSLMKSEAADIMRATGVEWLNIFSVDNVLQKIADPSFIGATIENKCDVGSKVVKKVKRDEKVGVMCLEDKKPSIVEYYELTEEMMDAKDSKGEPVYNFGVILNYLFNLSKLQEIARKQLPLHIVEKKIEYLDENGTFVKPENPNGYKFETLVLDMIHLADSCLPYEVIRDYEFAPIKNKTGVDSVESARQLCIKNGIEL
jgi:UDP-N-acetylglucosamine/UDP-N-acetylgalactosamine diphosphorylase